MKNSATGMASHTPVTPRIGGSAVSESRMNTNVRANEITAEVFPSESAVNSAEEKILNPLNKNARQKREKPSTAS